MLRTLQLSAEATYRLGHRIIGNRVHKSDPQSLRSRDLLSRCEHLQSASFAYESRQSLGASPARN